MTDVIWNKTNPKARGVSVDGLITDVNSGDLGNADTSYTYFLLAAAGFNQFVLDYDITATTLTIEASADDLSVENAADELITATNDRSFAGAGNWTNNGSSGATVTVAGGDLDVVAGSAGGGAKLDKAYFNSGKGFENTRGYTVLVTISNTANGTISIYAGRQLLASGLTDGAAQSFTLNTRAPAEALYIVGSAANTTFTIDDVSIKHVGATWGDITSTLTAGAATDFTADGRLTVNAPISWPRLRVKRVTTNATNALELRLTRMNS